MLNYDTIKLKVQVPIDPVWQKVAESRLVIKLLKRKTGDIGSFIRALKFFYSCGEMNVRESLIVAEAISTLERKINSFITFFHDEIINLDLNDEQSLRCLLFELPQSLRVVVVSFRFKDEPKFKLNLFLLETIVSRISCYFQQDVGCNV